MISIIIPCSDEYRLKYLPECLETVTRQLGNNELIIEKFDPKTEGFADILNNTILRCKGEFVLVLGADDKLGEGCIDKMESEIGPEDVYYGNLELFGDENRIAVPYKNLDFKFFLKGNRIPITSLFRKNRFLKVGGYWQSTGCPEDWELWTRMAKYGAKFKYINTTILKYRVHKNQAWATMKYKNEAYKKELNNRLKYDFFQLMW